MATVNHRIDDEVVIDVVKMMLLGLLVRSAGLGSLKKS